MARRNEQKKPESPKTENSKKEPVFIVRPASNKFGLDYLHITLIVLVLVLVALAFSLSSFKPTTVVKTCAYGAINGTCTTPQHNSSAALKSAEKILASYGTINSSLSLLPYYSLVNESKVEYMPNSSMWLVIIPYLNPFTKEVLNVSMLLYGSNLSLAEPYMQMLRPISNTSDYVIAPGVVKMAGHAACSYNQSMPISLVTDPYAPGTLSSIEKALNESRKLGSRINMSYDFIFSDYSIGKYSSFGVQTTQALGQYLSCASLQSQKYGAFVENLSRIYTGNPISNFTLYQVATGSGLNMSLFNTCMQNISTKLDYQAKLAQFYGITSTPVFVLDCAYLSIPETLNESIAYALNATKK
ncbi:MAG: DsbA family protein [Candidatus Micrarchaeia archaeon]